MTGSWTNKTWGEIATIEYGKGLREYADKTGRFPVYGTNGQIGWHNEAICQHPGVVIGRKGAYRGVHYSKGPFFVIDTAFYLEPKEQLDLRWAYYSLLTADINGMDSGSAIPSTSRVDFYALPVSLPPLSEQRAIAHILGSLDDKIELNRQMNETLEAMARAIFKSWFVDFDPVRAKMNGDDYPLDAATMALFPDRFVDSALGEVPEGWEVGVMGEEVELAYGKALKADNRRQGSVPVFGSNGQVGWHNESLVAGPGIVVGRKGNPGTVTWCHVNFYPIDTTFYVVPVGRIHSLPYLFFALDQQNLFRLSADSAVPGLNRNLAYMNSVLFPSENVLRFFDRQIEAMFERMHVNDEETRTLAELRDTLLPKLISGELRVPEAAAMIGEAL